MVDKPSDANLLLGIPGKQAIINKRIEYQTTAFLHHVLQLFRDKDGDNNYFFNAVATDEGWSWAGDVPFSIEPLLETAIRDTLAEKWYDKITFEEYSVSRPGFTRVTIFVDQE